MSIKIHGRATTTPAIRKKIQESNQSITSLARRYGISDKTVRKWKNRTNIEDQKCGPTPRSKSLSAQEEAAVISFRKLSLLPLDDCLYSLKETIPHLSRSTLHRCFQRHGINRLPQEQNENKANKKFKYYSPGYVHLDIAQIYTEQGKLYLFVAIDRTTKFCVARLYKEQKASTAVKFLQTVHAAFPNMIKYILTDNGLQFTNQKGDHIFTERCKALGIEHRRTKAYTPQTNGQVERMNRTLKEATVKKFYYNNHEILQKHLESFMLVYNYAKNLKTLHGLTPYEKSCLYLQSADGKSYLNPKYKYMGPYT